MGGGGGGGKNNSKTIPPVSTSNERSNISPFNGTSQIPIKSIHKKDEIAKLLFNMDIS